MVADRARAQTASSAALDEEEVYADLGEHLLRAGVQAEDVVDHILVFARLPITARSSFPMQEEVADPQPLEQPRPAE